MISADYTINRNKTRLFVIYCNVVNKSDIYIFFYIQELLQKFMTQSQIHIRIHVELCNTLSFVFFKICSLKQSVRAKVEQGALPHPPHSTLWFISIHFVGFLGYDSWGCPIGLLAPGIVSGKDYPLEMIVLRMPWWFWVFSISLWNWQQRVLFNCIP